MSRTCVLAMSIAFRVAALGADPAPVIDHSFLATGAETYIFDPSVPGDGVVWRYPASTRDGYVLPHGDVLLAVTRSNRFPGGAVVQITRGGREKVRYSGTQAEVNSAQPLPGGGVLLTEAGPRPRLMEIDSQDKVVLEFPLQCQTADHHMQTRMARKLPDGTYLVPHLFDFAVKNYDSGGKVLGVIDTTSPGDPTHQVHTWPFTAIRLPEGHTLCGLTHSNRVAEFDSSGKVIWQLSNDDLPPEARIKDACGVQRLPNGNTVVTSYAEPGAAKLVEVTRDKKVVWIFHRPAPHGIHHFQILTTNGRPVDGQPMK